MSWHQQIKKGDGLRPNPLWNRTEREPNKLDTPTYVLAVKHAQCETGVLVQVRTRNGQTRWLSAGWFTEVI